MFQWRKFLFLNKMVICNLIRKTENIWPFTFLKSLNETNSITRTTLYRY
jgi:hypothetical protein